MGSPRLARLGYIIAKKLNFHTEVIQTQHNEGDRPFAACNSGMANLRIFFIPSTYLVYM